MCGIKKKAKNAHMVMSRVQSFGTTRFNGTAAFPNLEHGENNGENSEEGGHAEEAPESSEAIPGEISSSTSNEPLVTPQDLPEDEAPLEQRVQRRRPSRRRDRESPACI